MDKGSEILNMPGFQGTKKGTRLSAGAGNSFYINKVNQKLTEKETTDFRARGTPGITGTPCAGIVDDAGEFGSSAFDYLHVGVSKIDNGFFVQG